MPKKQPDHAGRLAAELRRLAAEIEDHRAAMATAGRRRAELARQLIDLVGSARAGELLEVSAAAVRHLATGRSAGTIAEPALAPLITDGRLAPGTELILRRRTGPDARATVLEDGQLALRGSSGTPHRTPSGAARAVLRGGPVDGWLRWRVADGRTLAELRDAEAPEPAGRR